MKKIQKIFLCIGILLIIVSTVIIAYNSISSLNESYVRATVNGIYKSIAEFWIWWFLGNIFFNAPIILSEILLVINGYVFLGKEKTKFQKTFCLISSALILIGLVLLYIGKNSNYMYHVRQNYITTSWILLLISFAIRVFSSIKGLKK